LHARHERGSYLTTHLLPLGKRPYAWALHGFARRVDEYVNSLPVADPEQVRTWGAGILTENGQDRTDPVGLALLHTMRQWSIPRTHVEAFLDSACMDMTTTRYATYTDLEQYVYGASSVVGLQLLPILQPLAPETGARIRTMGEAFQMAEFIRDVGTDLERDRIYLPQEDMETFGVTQEALRDRVVTAPIRELLRFEIERSRRLFGFAEPGIDMLHPTSRVCVRTAFTLHLQLLEAVEDAHYQVLTQRVEIPWGQRWSVMTRASRQARATRRDQNRWVNVNRPRSTAEV
jgi:phytoene synthase